MLMDKKDRVAIYNYLFQEGVLVAKKDFHLAQHPAIPNVKNLHVIKTLQSLKSKGWVKEQFAWRHYYYFLTNDGIKHLRDALNLPAEIVPSTLKRRQVDARPRPASTRDGPAPGTGKSAEERSAYRRTETQGGTDKKSDVGPGAADLQFRGGYGRGRNM